MGLKLGLGLRLAVGPACAVRCFRKDDGQAALGFPLSVRQTHGPRAGAGRGVRLRLPYVAGETLSLSPAQRPWATISTLPGVPQSLRRPAKAYPQRRARKCTPLAPTPWGWQPGGQALGERAYLRRSAPSLKASAATRMLGAAATTAACTAVTASTDTHIPEAALSCRHQAMLVSSRIGRRRTALVHARRLVGWVASSASAASVPLSGPAERSAVEQRGRHRRRSVCRRRSVSSALRVLVSDRGDVLGQPCERSSATVVTCLGRL